MRLTTRVSVIFLCTICVGACGAEAGDGSDGGSRWNAVVDTIGDTVVVHTTSGRAWDSDRELVSEVSIGVLDGEAVYQFGDLDAIAVGKDGTIFAYDSHVPVIRQYGPDGVWLKDLGREGGGPGEYKQPDSGLTILPDGRLAVRDPGNGRILLFSEDGEYLDYFRIAGSFSTSRPLVADTAGNLVTYVITNLGAPVLEWKRGRARYRPDGTVDTIPSPDLGFKNSVISGQHESSSSSSYVPYTAMQVIAYSPLGYFIIGISNDYRFDLLRPEGVLRVGREWEPVPVDPEDSAIERERMTQDFKQRFPGWKWNGPPIPDLKPAYLAFYLSQDGGRIWVHVPAQSERYMDAEELRAEEERLDRPVNPYREPVRFDVFEVTGEYLGQVATPDGFSLYPRPVFRGDMVWGVVRDEYDVQRLHRFRLESAVPQ